MAQKNTQLKSQSPLIDPNYKFLSSLNRYRIENQQINIDKLSQKIQDILNKCIILDRNEIEQWRSVQQNKIYQLAKCTLSQSNKQEQRNSTDKVRIKALKQHLRIIVYVCYRLKIQYAKDSIMQIIKKLYFREYKQQIFAQFQDVGYSTNQFRVLTYPQSSFFNFCCCVQQNSFN